QLPPAPQPAPAYIQPAPPPSNGYTLGVYTQVVPVPSFGAPGGGPALAYVNPGQGGGPLAVRPDDHQPDPRRAGKPLTVETYARVLDICQQLRHELADWNVIRQTNLVIEP
ncbi:hypothetical protein AB1L30_00300, partial [Bremerella sp. JC817]|uniref:hypothetical protein n=1 Tax=Bremerella sp. JC817 TaxID=3231756 RepID=UPI0034585A0B